LRIHGLLNNLHTVLGTTPLVLFYPGRFDGASLRLFGELNADQDGPGKKPYYRAFILAPRSSL